MFLTTIQNDKDKQIFFLENLLLKLKNNQLSLSEQRDLSEFYIKNMFINTQNEINERNYSIDEKKFNKYLYMGWYIYEFLISNNK
jgi:hypothetical protein